MPPPNITGILHMGHAYFGTLQDILTRFRRMRGDDALWLPGTDHAGLATQQKLDALMREQGLDPDGPEFDAFAERYKAGLQGTITRQIRRIGASCDWSRETFTLDERYSRAVTEALRRCHDAGMLSRADGQWWLDMSGLAARLLQHLDAGDIRIIPEDGAKTLRHFLQEIQPWCISRQIRWGHRMPLWTLPDGSLRIADDAPAPGAIRESNALDTWFSSALWPFATLGWPEETDDLRRYYPASLIETAGDIIFFWCARMMMMGLLLTDQLPFRTIYLHGIIRDKNGEKMSKSLGNGIDPLEIIGEYGCDAMRFALAENTTAGQDMRLWPEKFDAARAFRTKLWNAARFCLRHHERLGRPPIARPSAPTGDNAELLTRFDRAAREATDALEAFDFRQAAYTLRHFLWDDFCTWYLEAAKARIYDGDREALATLMWTLDGTLRLLHPFIPFITERIRSAYADEPLITDTWPIADPDGDRSGPPGASTQEV